MTGSNENLAVNDQPNSNESTEYLKRLFFQHFKLDVDRLDLTSDFKSALKDLTLDFNSLNSIFQSFTN